MFEVRPQTERPDGKRIAVVLSDVHIGNNLPTCWYQAAVHERPLKEALAWILARRSIVREVVLLGDMFDVWTYPPWVRPPSMREIIAANPGMLGSRGPLAALVQALPGEVRLLLGNHDGSLTRADIDLLNRSLGGDPSRGQRIELVTAPSRVVAGASGARTVFSHGHHWCMFNAPDARSRWATIPIGHFVSRAIGYRLSRGRWALKPGETAADRPNSGNPAGVNAFELIRAWRRVGGDLAAFLLDYFCRNTGMPKTERVLMPDGSTTTAEEAARVFSGLFTLWARREGRWQEALRAAFAEYPGGEHLAWFAQRLAMRTASDLAVMGHTHSVVGGLAVSPVNYLNSGYMCVARPDAAQITFTQVDLERATAQVMAVVGRAGGLSVIAARAPVMRSAIISPASDFSCYARIQNRSDRTLRRVRAHTNSVSFFPARPPERIPPHARADIWLSDVTGPRGSAGGFTYSDGAQVLDFVLECPTLGANVVRSPVDYATRTQDRPWRRGGVDPDGHPVQARFYVGAPVPAGVGPGPAPAAASGNGGVRLPPGDRIVEGGEYLSHGRYLMRVGGRHVVNPRAVDAARGRRIRWQPSGLVATIDSVRVEDQGPMRGGRRVRVVMTLRVLSPGTSGHRVGNTIELPWRAFSHGGIVESLAPS
jgi:UDP-2,3-diacylglucosamine hydrolase